jgi:putative transcriptional regulator
VYSAVYDHSGYDTDPAHKAGGRGGVMKNLRLKSARAAKDLSQEELAREVGVSRQTISAIEKGDYNPTIRLCVKICKTLDRTLDELFWEEA